jgi:hypothetical protein
MPLTGPKFKRDDKVTVDGHPATVIRYVKGKVTVRNRFGFQEDVKPKDVKKRDD